MNMVDKVLRYREVSLKNGSLNRYVTNELTNVERIAKHIYNTAKIEGNAFTENDTIKLITGVLPMYEAQNKYNQTEIFEIDGLVKAYEHIYKTIKYNEVDSDFINDIHVLAYGPIAEHSKGIYEGEYRNYGCYTYRKDGSRKDYLHYEYIEDRMEDMIFYYNKSNKSNKTLEDIAILKLDFIHIHPYGDGNGRVSRLLLNWALMSNGFPPIIIEYEEKDEYIECLNIYGETEDSTLFTDFLCKKLIDVYKVMLDW